MAAIVKKSDPGRSMKGLVLKPETARWLALGAVAGQLLFTLAWFVLGFLSPGFMIFGTRIEPYSAITTPLSGLGLGPTGPYMNGAFVVGGLLTLAGVFGIFLSLREMSARARWVCIALFAQTPLGMVIDGIFTLESSMPHTLGFLLGAVTPVVGFVVAGLALRRIPRWRTFGGWLLIGSLVTVALAVLYMANFNLAAVMAGQGVAGLTERVLTVEISAWLAALGWLTFRRAPVRER